MILGGNPLLLGADAGGYQISRSLRLRAAAGAYLSRTPASAGNRTTWTLSFWIKPGDISTGLKSILAGAYSTVSGGSYITFSNNTINFAQNNSGTTVIAYTSSALFRDPSAWYHITIVFNTSAATGNRAIVYVNGNKITMTGTEPPLNHATFFVNAAAAHYFGQMPIDGAPQRYLDGYVAEVNFIDGQALTPSDFGQTDPITGVWGPKKYTGTYGTNGYYLNFNDNSGATATTIGKDSSGNSNNWTPTNVSVTAGITYDSMIDSPTPAGAAATQPVGNYAVLNPLIYDSLARTQYTGGNLGFTLGNGTTGRLIWSSMPMKTGKWYAEFTLGTTVGTNAHYCGLIPEANTLGIRNTGNTNIGANAGEYAYGRVTATFASNAAKLIGGTATNNGTTLPVAGDVIGLAFDADGGTLSVYLNGVQQTVTGMTPPAGTYFFGVSAAGYAWAVNFGQRPFSYTPPAGYKALCSTNLPETAIKKGNQYFDATLFNGTGVAQNIINAAGFQPAFVWEKTRSAAANHILVDAVRGATKEIYSNDTVAETTNANGITGFLSNGFSIGTSYAANTHVGWQWKNGGSVVTDTSGSISSQVKADPVAGFSIVTYTGNGIAGATIGHGLGVAPAFIMIKARSGAQPWNCYFTCFDGSLDYMVLNTTAAKLDSAQSNPTSSVFSVSAGVNVNGSGTTYVAYCFTDIPGYSKVGTWVGNASTDGPFVHTGFRPGFVLSKCITTGGVGYDWQIFDSKINTSNLAQVNTMNPNSNGAEYVTTAGGFDLLANGFKVRNSGPSVNGSGASYLYMAFAENPFKYALAR